MMNLDLQRLYLIYQSGSQRDGRKNSNLLQLAKAIGPDLSEAEFEKLATQVREIEKQFDAKKQSRLLQSALWSLPAEVKSGRSVNFQPVRTKGNQPIFDVPTESTEQIAEKLKSMGPEDVRHSSALRNAWHAAKSGELETLIDHADPEGTQARFKKLAYSSVASNPVHRDAWHAAQSGKLSELLRNGDLWQTFTDPQAFQSESKKFGSNRSHFGGAIRSLMESSDRGEFAQRMENARRAYSKDLPTHNLYSDPIDQVVERLTSFDSNRWQQHYIRSVGLNDQGFRSTSSPDEVRAYVEQHRLDHEQQVNQKLVDYQVGSYKPPKQTDHAPPVDPNATGPSFTQMRKNVLQGGKYDGMTAEDITKAWANESSDSPSEQPPGSKNHRGGRSFVDNMQIALDAIGVFDPTPFTDLSNSIISLTRVVREPSKASRHLVNAGISMLGTIPGFGDIAKLGKDYGDGGNPASHFIGDYVKNRFGSFAVDYAKKKFGPNVAKIVEERFGVGAANAAARTAAGGAARATGAAVAGAAAGAGGAGGAAGGAAAAGAGAAGLGVVVGFAIAVGVVIYALKKLNDWINKTAENGRRVLEENRHLAIYSGKLSVAYMNYDANSQMLEQKKAQYLAPALSGLARSQSQLETSIQNRTNPYAWAKTKVLTGLNEGAYIASEMLGKIDFLGYLLGEIKKNTEVAIDDESRSALEHSIRSMNVPVPQRKLPAAPVPGQIQKPKGFIK